MELAPIPVNEQARLKELLSFQILDSPEEKDYNELLELAAHISDCPTATISFIDANRQWFKSAINITTKENPRDTSFCGHVITKSGVFIVEDTSKDVRFFDNPHVTGMINIVFYAAAPIRSDNGFSLGTVCVIDHKPKSFSEVQKDALQKIATQVSKLMELRKHRLQNNSLIKNMFVSGANSDSILDSYFLRSPSAKVIFDQKGYKIVDVNEPALKLYGYTRETFMRLNALDIRANKSVKLLHKLLAKIETRQDSFTVTTKHITKNNKPFPVILTFSPLVYKGERAWLVAVQNRSEKKGLKHDLQKEKYLTEIAIQHTAVSAIEKNSIRDELQENINQILATTNLYLCLARANADQRNYLIEKSRQNVLEAMLAVKKLSKSIGTKSPA